MFNVEEFIENSFGEDLPKELSKKDLVKFSKSLLDSYRRFICTSVLDGKSVTIDGLGVIRPSYRRVKNPMGREFSIKAKIDNNKDFEKKLVNEFKKNPDKFGFNI